MSDARRMRRRVCGRSWRPELLMMIEALIEAAAAGLVPDLGLGGDLKVVVAAGLVVFEFFGRGTGPRRRSVRAALW